LIRFCFFKSPEFPSHSYKRIKIWLIPEKRSIPNLAGPKTVEGNLLKFNAIKKADS
jgi:hypothetical protein